MNAAIAKAAHDTLTELFLAQGPDVDAALSEDLKSIPDSQAKNNGINLGQRAATANWNYARTTAPSTESRVSASIT